MIFDEKIVDMVKKCKPIVTESFIRRTRLNISLAFITQFYFTVSKNIRLNSMHYFLMKITNKKEFQQIAFNNLSDFDCQDFMNLYKEVYCKTIRSFFSY